MSAPSGADDPAPSPDSALRHLAAELTRDPAFVELLERERSTAMESAEALIADLAARLRPACAHLADTDFAALMLDIARMKVRFARIDERWAQRGGAIPSVDG